MSFLLKLENYFLLCCLLKVIQVQILKILMLFWLSPDEWLIYGKDIDKNLEINF